MNSLSSKLSRLYCSFINRKREASPKRQLIFSYTLTLLFMKYFWEAIFSDDSRGRVDRLIWISWLTFEEWKGHVMSDTKNHSREQCELLLWDWNFAVLHLLKPCKILYDLPLAGCWLSSVNDVTTTNYRSESEQMITLAELLLSAD